MNQREVEREVRRLEDERRQAERERKAREREARGGNHHDLSARLTAPVGAGILLILFGLVAVALFGGNDSSPPVSIDLASASPSSGASPPPSRDITPTLGPSVTSGPLPTPDQATEKPEPPATRKPRPDQTPAPLPAVGAITEAKVIRAAEAAGLTCQRDSFGAACDATTGRGTDLSATSTGSRQDVEQVVLTAFGDKDDARQFLTRMCQSLLGSRGPAVVSWFVANQDESVIERTFGPYHVTYRGPLDFASLDITPG